MLVQKAHLIKFTIFPDSIFTSIDLLRSGNPAPWQHIRLNRPSCSMDHQTKLFPKVKTSFSSHVFPEVIDNTFFFCPEARSKTKYSHRHHSHLPLLSLVRALFPVESFVYLLFEISYYRDLWIDLVFNYTIPFY